MRDVKLDCFEDAQALDRAALEAVLQAGRPEQRIWATWALALRARDGGAGLARRAAHEPDAGVRRTLAVLLAGHGETELLLALARHDPALVVRESAVQLATRLALGGTIDPAILLDLAARDPALRVALLGGIGAGAPPGFVAFAIAQLAAPREPAVQLEAFEALLRVGTTSTRDAARAWMLAQDDIALVVPRWLRTAGVVELAEAFAGARPSRRGAVLRCLREPPWRAVELLVGTDAYLLLEVLQLRPDIAIPARVLGRAILGGAHHGFVPRLTTTLVTASRGRALVAELRRAIEDEADSSTQLHALAIQARRYAEAVEIEGAAALLDELAGHHPVEHLLGLEHALVRWLGGDAPAELVELLPELHRYAVAQLARLGGRTRPGTAPLALPGQVDAGPAAAPWDEAAAFRDLVAAIERLQQQLAA